MNERVNSLNEQAAEKAFSKQSAIFDQLYSSNIIIQYKRRRVREHVSQYLKPDSRILELNAGTGEDAIWFAEQGHRVHATDISTRMQEKLADKVKQANLGSKISTEICSFSALEELKNRGPYDLIFSNFAGLNCTPELDKVLRSFSSLLHPGGIVTLVILPKFCLWETMMLVKGEFKTAFRRFFGRKGVKANIEGEQFTCWYYNPSYVTRSLKDGYNLLSVEGLCTMVPPSYLENFPFKRPALFKWLKEMEDKWKSKWPWKNIGDYYIISFRKKS
ncbi:MAG TPA: methyltransferase domain-containing protein [Chitinophagaceae bacterium]|nr:methyltransferase domain-containing protein [Chitinophagaceae bacterium]